MERQFTKKTMRQTNIDGNKLRVALKKFPVEQRVMSRALGYGANYLSVSCSVGRIATSALEDLEKMYGLKADTFTVDVKQPTLLDTQKKKETTKEPETTTIPINNGEIKAEKITCIELDELYDTFYRAVYDAMTKCLREGADVTP